MDNFQKKFLEEATDLINRLEEVLLNLENDFGNENLIDEVFRIMHSLKGGSGMFGFEQVSAFTHNLENIYDLIRNQKLQLSRELLDITLTSIDHLRYLFNIGDQNQDSEHISEEELNEKIRSFTDNSINNSNNINEQEEKNSEEKNIIYHIHFHPFDYLIKNGNNPFYLIDELATLGKLKSYPKLESIPDFNILNPVNIYIRWDFILSTNKGKDAIADVFIFVEDDCELIIEEISDSDYILDDNIFLSSEEENIFNIKEKIKKHSEDFNKPEVDKKEKRKVKEHLQNFSKENVISSIRVSSEKIDLLMNLVSELVTTQASLNLYADEKKLQGLNQIVENLENITRQLRDTSFNISLIPIDNLIVRFKRLIRDLSNEFGKQINFITEGAETELDKTLIEGITDPLMHILRNSIDHGIENKEERKKLGKPIEGTVKLKAYYSGSHIIIKIEDDGKGIDPKIIKQKAIDKGYISSDAELSDKEILDLVFIPGFSTASNITNISGRGVGMDVVKRKIADIRGEVELNSKVNVGTVITIKLPLTLSIIDGMLVRIESTDFLMPLSVVDTIYAVKHEKITKAFNNVIALEGVQIPYYYLREEFNMAGEAPEMEEVIVVKFEEKRIGLVVDNVVGEYQAVLKPLGKMYREQEMFSGATILGDGSVALVLDTHKIINEFSTQTVNT